MSFSLYSIYGMLEKPPRNLCAYSRLDIGFLRVFLNDLMQRTVLLTHITGNTRLLTVHTLAWLANWKKHSFGKAPPSEASWRSAFEVEFFLQCCKCYTESSTTFYPCSFRGSTNSNQNFISMCQILYILFSAYTFVQLYDNTIYMFLIAMLRSV